MKVWPGQFNLYLALGILLGLLCGCRTDRPKGPVSLLRVYLEASPRNPGAIETVSVLRANPVLVTIDSSPILSEAQVLAAKVIQAPGGPALEIQFDRTGARLLEQYTAGNPGRHLVIYAEWGKKPAHARWLAAPLITRRIGDGLLSFTPDASPTGCDQIVQGLNNVARSLHDVSQ